MDDSGAAPRTPSPQWKETVVTKYYGTGTGKVTDVGPAYSSTGEYLGKKVEITYVKDGSTWVSKTIHHKDVLVKKGDDVAPGQAVAVGAGYGDQFGKPNAGDPHVHWTVARDGVLVHPLNGAPIATPQ
jgi:hypothetical protein